MRVPSPVRFVLGVALVLVLAVLLSPVPSDLSDLQGTSPQMVGAGETPSGRPVLVGHADGTTADTTTGAVRVATDAADRLVADADVALEETEELALAHLRGGLPLTVDHPHVAPVIEVQERYTRELFSHPLVVGTATGMNERGEIAVVVLTKEEVHGLPETLDGVPVMQFVSGELFASGRGGKGGGGGGGPPPVDPTARFARPVPIGVSTGHPSITAGTIGCRVVGAGTVFALSNNHVYADENDASLGDAVIQPGTFDGGASPADDIGSLDDFEPIDFTTVAAGGANEMDAAIAMSTTGTLGNATPSNGYGVPRTTTASAAINLRVSKYGRTTGLTSGKIFAINASVNVGYATGVAGYVKQIVITPGSFSGPGDSGSLIVGQKGGDARKPVGLLFAGSSSSTIASPIGPILSRFAVTVDGN